jgi:hypothetical protein
MDWGFGNPNKTATLIALIMVAVWALAYIRKWGFWTALTLFTGFGVCLILTQSRGGLIGAAIGCLIVLAWAQRPFLWRHSLAVFTACVALAIFTFATSGESRYAKGLTGEDQSIGNRLLIWKQVPSMIHDAPNGWGLGKSGDAYMQWYQPVTRGEGYRTLVSSHLTWLVELNWWGRIAYVLAWVFVLILVWPHSDYRWFSIPLGVWISFLICAFFSSVAEAWPLWVIPALALLSVLVVRFKRRIWPASRVWWGSALGSVLVIGAFFVWVERSGYPLMISSSAEGVVTLGQKSPQIWIITPNTAILGEHYGHEVRRGFADEPIYQQMGLGVVVNSKNVPKNQIVVFSGQIPSSVELLTPTQLIVIDPKPVASTLLQPFLALRSITVVIGEYSRNKDYWNQQAHLHPNIKLQLVVGSEEYIPNWMHEVADAIKGK